MQFLNLIFIPNQGKNMELNHVYGIECFLVKIVIQHAKNISLTLIVNGKNLFNTIASRNITTQCDDTSNAWRYCDTRSRAPMICNN